MNDAAKSKEELIGELSELRRRVAELEALKAEQGHTEEALLESEQNFKAMAENANDGIFIAADEGFHVYANSRAAEITGYTVSELLKKTIKDLAHPDDFETIMKRYKTIVEGKPFARQYETRVVRKDGEVVPLEAASARTVWRGKPADIVIFRDITERKRAEEELQAAQEALEHEVEQRTAQLVEANEQLKHEIEERKQAEEALREAEEQYRTLVERASDAIIIIQDEKTVYRNPIYQELIGFSTTETMGRSFLDFVVPEDRNRVRDHYYKRLKGDPVPEKYEVRLLTRSGRHLTMEVKPCVIEYKGETATMVLMRDITERREAEEALRESEERFRSIFEKSRDAICLIDSERRYLMVNEAMCELIGVPREELLNKHYSTFMDKETHELMEQHWLQRRRSEPAPDRYEFKLIRSDGGIRIIDNVPTVIHFQDKPPLTLAILRDVTERRRMEDALESMRSKLLNLQESERSTISRVLHDTIGQNIGILDFNLATIVEMLDETSRESISALIDNMRNVIRETGDKLRDISSGLHPRLVQELGLVAGVRNLIDRFQGATWIEVHSSIKINELHIDESVAVNLYRIVQEALTNIVKHSKCGSVLFEMAVDDGRLGVMVKDDGTGFSLEDVSQRDIEQRGMGLFIMEERAKAIGGRLQIHSEPDKGTKVQVEVLLNA
ncbi:MAG: PAS domain S-box protein [Proteobacteria bacterium]|nr:PAS domain S-box protein [Pseudomonadota bacterium]